MDDGHYEHTKNHPKSRNNAQIYGDDADESDEEYAAARSAYEAKEKEEMAKRIAESEESARKNALAESQKSKVSASTEFEERFKSYSAFKNVGPAPKFGHFSFYYSEIIILKSPKITKFRSRTTIFERTVLARV